MGTRELVKSGKLSVSDALANFKGLRKNGQYVGDDIIRWLENRKDTVFGAKPQAQQKRKQSDR